MSDKLRPCFKCGTEAPLNSDSLCITCGDPDTASSAGCACPLPDHKEYRTEVHRDSGTATRYWRAYCCGATWADEKSLLDIHREADEPGDFAHLDAVAVVETAAQYTGRITQDEESRLRMIA